MTCPLIHRLLNNERWIYKHLAYYRNTIKFFIFFSLVSNIFWQGDHCHFSTCRNLPVNSRMTACNVFLNMPVNSSYQMCKLFNCFIKCAIWPFVEAITFGIIYDKTIKMTPIVIKIFYKTGYFISVFKKNRGFIKNMRNNTALVFNE